VNSKGREKADYTVGHTRTGHGKRVVLCWFGVSHSVETACDVLNLASADQRPELIAGKSRILHLSWAKECPYSSLSQALDKAVFFCIITHNVDINSHSADIISHFLPLSTQNVGT